MSNLCTVIKQRPRQRGVIAVLIATGFPALICAERTTPKSLADNNSSGSKANNAGDWRQFRGPRFNTTNEKGLPLKWSATDNIAWKAALPGPGSSSPIVVGDRVFVTCYTRGDSKPLVRHLVCIARGNGRILWTRSIRATGRAEDLNAATRKHGFASHSPTCDGRRVFVHLGNSGVYAFDLSGKQLWKADIGKNTAGYGSAASLVIHGKRLLVNASIESGSFIALDTATGRRIWRVPLKRSYTTPITFKDAAGREIACVTDNDRGFVGFNPATGREVWRWKGFYEPGYGCSSPVLLNGVIYGTASNEGPIAAFRPTGTGDITKAARVWADTTRYRPRVTSPVIHDGKMFWIENSVGVVYDIKNGKKLNGERMPWRKGCYATPLLAEGRLYITTNYDGTYVMRADTTLKKVLAHNVIADETEDDRPQLNTSPVPHRGQLLLRTNKALYCIGRK